MGALFSRIKTWLKNENLKAGDVNAEFDNILTNFAPNKMSGDSTNLTQMQIERDPGGAGTESLAQTTAEEIESLRFVINRIIGGAFWYSTPDLTIDQINALISQGNLTPPPNRIVSGLKRTSSNQPAFLVAGGSTAIVTLKGSVTPFVYYVAGTQYTISTDVNLTFSSFAPSSNNTATVNDATLAGGATTVIQGEGSSVLTVTAAGANITALQGNFAAFKIVDGGNTEYFIGFVNSATSLIKCFRGFYFDSTSAPVVRVVVNNSDTITLYKLFWVFATTAGTLDSCATNPKVQFATPSSPASGDYWFDLSASIWKKYNGSAFVASDATLIGQAICDTSHCIATRSFEFYAPYDSKNTCVLEIQDNNTVRTTQAGQVANVAGTLINFQKALQYWIKPDNLVSGDTDGNNKTFYIYLKDTGEVALGLTIPYNRVSDLGGSYHPHNPWRSLGAVTNDGSSHFTSILQDASYSDLIASGISTAGTTAIANTMTAANINLLLTKSVLAGTDNSAFVGVSITALADITTLAIPAGGTYICFATGQINIGENPGTATTNTAATCILTNSANSLLTNCSTIKATANIAVSETVGVINVANTFDFPFTQFVIQTFNSSDTLKIRGTRTTGTGTVTFTGHLGYIRLL